MAAHSPSAVIPPSVPPDQPPGNWASWLRQMAQAINDLGRIVHAIGISAPTLLPYRVDTLSTAATDPGAGRMRYNHATQNLATALYIDRLTLDDIDISLMLRAASTNDRIAIQDADMATTYQIWQQIGPAIDRTDWYEVPVSFISEGGPGGVCVFDNNAAVMILARG